MNHFVSILTLLILATFFSGFSFAAETSFPSVLEAHQEHLTEIWRVGGEDSEHIFGTIQTVKVDSKGNIYVLDSQLAQVVVLSSNGKSISTIGRTGEGPGEYRSAIDLCFLSDNELGVAQMFPGQIVGLGLDGSPGGKTVVVGPQKETYPFLRGLRASGGTVVAAGYFQSRNAERGGIDRSDFVGILDEAGGLKSILSEHEYFLDMANFRLFESELMASPFNRFDVGASGQIAIAIPRNSYQISVFSNSGDLVKVLSRPYESWPRSDEAKSRWLEIFESVKRTQAPQAEIQVEPVEPDIECLEFQDNGTLWVLTSRGMWEPPNGAFAAFDVFGESGALSHQVHFVCPGEAKHDRMFNVGGDQVLVVSGYWDAFVRQFGGQSVANEDTGPMELICYKRAN